MSFISYHRYFSRCSSTTFSRTYSSLLLLLSWPDTFWLCWSIGVKYYVKKYKVSSRKLPCLLRIRHSLPTIWDTRDRRTQSGRFGPWIVASLLIACIVLQESRKVVKVTKGGWVLETIHIGGRRPEVSILNNRDQVHSVWLNYSQTTMKILFKQWFGEHYVLI